MPSKLSKNPEVRKRQKQRRRERIKARKAADPAYRKMSNRRKQLSTNFGISLDDYATLREAQDNKCGICGLEPKADERALAVDHDHETDYIRGLLCFSCNVGLGHFKDDERLLALAIEWVQRAK